MNVLHIYQNQYHSMQAAYTAVTPRFLFLSRFSH
jgi:hypothetical protein